MTAPSGSAAEAEYGALYPKMRKAHFSVNL
jgi:hypothetical protein